MLNSIIKMKYYIVYYKSNTIIKIFYLDKNDQCELYYDSYIYFLPIYLY